MGNAAKDEILSFDLDGTLVEHDFSTVVWREAIPALVAQQRGLPVEEAKQWVFRHYDEVGEGSLAWYDLSYWYERFGIEEDWRETLRRHRPLIRLFSEVRPVLEFLRANHRLLLLSNASRPFIQAEMEEGGLNGIFERVISATSDFCEVKKTREFYLRVCRVVGLDPSKLLHVGDHWEFDYLAPREAGIRAYFLDRAGQKDGPDVVRDLKEFAGRLLYHQ
jgi:HAD superfamily hydrolase (TIGR01549 family)